MAAAGSYHKLPDPDELIQCPYDNSHLIRFKKLVYHLMKCRQNHPSACMTCPFDARHQVPRLEWQLHMETCPQRALVEKDVAYHLLSESSTQRGDVSVPPYDAWVPPEPAESWDDDDGGGTSTYREPTPTLRDRQSIVSDRSDFCNTLETGMRDLNVRSRVPKPAVSTSDRGEPMFPQYGINEYREAYMPPSMNFDVPSGPRQVTPSLGVRGPQLASQRPLGQLSPHVPAKEPNSTVAVRNQSANLLVSSSLPSSNVPHAIQSQSAWSKPLVAAGAFEKPPVVTQPTALPGTQFTPGLRYPSPSPRGVTPAIPFGLSPAVGRGRSSVRLTVIPTDPPAPGRPAFSPQEKETRGHDNGRPRIAANFSRTPVVNRTDVDSPSTAVAADSASSSTLTVESSSDAERAAGDQESLMQQKLKRIAKKLRQISELEKKEYLDEDQKRKVHEKSELELERDRITHELKKLKNT